MVTEAPFLIYTGGFCRLRGKDLFNAQLYASGVAGKKITIALKKIADRSTGFKIRVGVFGDAAKSQEILESIKKRF